MVGHKQISKGLELMKWLCEYVMWKILSHWVSLLDHKRILLLLGWLWRANAENSSFVNSNDPPGKDRGDSRYVHNSQKINYSKGQRNGLVRKYRPAVLVVINVKGVVLKFWRVSAISTYHVNIYMVWCDSNGLLVPSKIIIFHPYGEE
jgi:hypothetical protein